MALYELELFLNTVPLLNITRFFFVLGKVYLISDIFRRLFILQTVFVYYYLGGLFLTCLSIFKSLVGFFCNFFFVFNNLCLFYGYVKYVTLNWNNKTVTFFLK